MASSRGTVRVAIADIRRAVEEGGQLALRHYGKVTRSVKADLSIVSEADAAVESFLRSALINHAPGYGYIGEETEESWPPADGETHSWVVDALDGSRAFVARIPVWTPTVCLLDGDRPVAGAAINPMTNELFWADIDGGAYCNDEPLRPTLHAELEPNSLIIGPTNYHRMFSVDFPGRIYCLGAPIYQLCLVARGAVSGMFFDPAVNLWDLALPTLLFEKTGIALVYASGRPVELSELMDRATIAEPIYAGSPDMVEIMRGRITYRG
jgi:myo-inositol-1(or 4)-monophosphatase